MEENQINELQKHFQNFLSDQGYADKTQRVYAQTWFNKFPQAQFYSLDNENAQKLINDFFKLKSNNNQVARAFLKLYLEFVELDKDYRIPKPKSIRKEFKFKSVLSKNEIEILGDAMLKSGYDKWLAFRLIYEGGLRRSELASVKYICFDWDRWVKDPDKMIVLKVFGKGSKERFVAISSHTILSHFNHLKEKHGISDQDIQRIIRDAKSKDIRLCKFGEEWFYKHLRRTSEKVLGRRVNPHLLRHTRATMLLDMKTEIKDIQNYLGHSNLATTELYLHRDKKKSIDNIMVMDDG